MSLCHLSISSNKEPICLKSLFFLGLEYEKILLMFNKMK